MTRHIIKSLVLGFGCFSLTSAANPLSLEGYLSEVQTKHEGARGAVLGSEAAEQRAGESGLSQAWMLNAGVEQRNDFRRPISVQFQNVSTFYSLGISKQTNFGLTGKLGMTVQPFTFMNVSAQFSSFLPFTSYYDVATTLELSQSLWGNGFGRGVRAQQERDEAVALGAHFRNAFALKQIYTQAETAYWTVAGYQEILRVQKENLERAQKLVASSKSKVSLDLADKTDLLQAESALRVRELELAQSNSEFRTASRQFNSLRGVDSDSIEEKLASVYIDEIEKVGPPTRGGVREDVAAAQQDAKVAFSNARLGAERNKPTLEAYVSHAFTGRDATLNSALQMMTRSIYTFSTVGVRFATPLNFGMLSADREAYVKEQAAADLNLSRKQFEQENEWRELSRRLLEGKEKLQLARSLEKAQSDKYHYERERLKRARTTLFQVLMFEQDYAAAQLNRLRVETEVRGILTQMKTFGGKT